MSADQAGLEQDSRHKVGNDQESIEEEEGCEEQGRHGQEGQTRKEKEMTLPEALISLKGRDDFNVVRRFIEEQKEFCLTDFQDPELIDNPSKLARLAGEIGGLVRIVEALKDPDEADSA